MISLAICLEIKNTEKALKAPYAISKQNSSFPLCIKLYSESFAFEKSLSAQGHFNAY